MENKLYKKIKKMNYTEFVGYVNQWNVLPGSYDTLSKWEVFSKLTRKSRILEFACTTGFSSRELALETNCQGIGFDICENSINSAIENKKTYAPKIKIDYFKMDGHNLNFKEKFTHIILGASLKFFKDPKKALENISNLLEERGHILASPFYITKKIPQEKIKKFEKIFNITPTTISYKEIMKDYRDFEIVFQEKNKIEKETKEELHHYCKSTIDRVSKKKKIKDQKIYNLMYERLLEIKKMSNELRPYQMYIILVLRYRKGLYKKRFVELF